MNENRKSIISHLNKFILQLTISSEQFEIDAKFQTVLHFEKKEAKTKNKYMKNKNFRKLKYVPGSPPECRILHHLPYSFWGPRWPSA
jgi:hypothetical protein